MLKPLKSLYDTPKVGADTLCFCTRCKMELAHIIVSMEGSRPAKVICKTCRSQHNFKRQTPLTLTAKKASVPREPRVTIRVAELWEKKLAEKHSDELKVYSVFDSYPIGTVIRHPKFGVGIVEEVKSSQKILLLFRDGERVLVHGQKKSGT